MDAEQILKCMPPVMIQYLFRLKQQLEVRERGQEWSGSFKDKGTTGTEKGSIYTFSSWIEMDLNCSSGFAV